MPPSTRDDRAQDREKNKVAVAALTEAFGILQEAWGKVLDTNLEAKGTFFKAMTDPDKHEAKVVSMKKMAAWLLECGDLPPELMRKAKESADAYEKGGKGRDNLKTAAVVAAKDLAKWVEEFMSFVKEFPEEHEALSQMELVQDWAARSQWTPKTSAGRRTSLKGVQKVHRSEARRAARRIAKDRQKKGKKVPASILLLAYENSDESEASGGEGSDDSGSDSVSSDHSRPPGRGGAQDGAGKEKKAAKPYAIDLKCEHFKRAYGEGIGAPEVWARYDMEVNRDLLRAVGKMLRVEKSNTAIVIFCDNKLAVQRCFRAFVSLAHAPMSFSDLETFKTAFSTPDWVDVQNCGLLSERLKVMLRDYDLSYQVGRCLEMLEEGVWPQYERDSTTERGRLYATWIEMVALFLVGRYGLRCPELCVHGYRAWGSALPEVILGRERRMLTPLEESVVTAKMSKARRNAGQECHMGKVSAEEIAGEDLVGSGEVIREEEHGSMRTRFGREASTYDDRLEVMDRLKGRSRREAAPAAGSLMVDPSTYALLQQLVSNGGLNGGHAHGGRGTGGGSAQGHGRGFGGRGAGRGAGGSPSATSAAHIPPPPPIPANGTTDPHSGQLAPLLPPGVRNHYRVGGDRDVRGRCWKCAKLADHMSQNCRNPHAKWDPQDPWHVMKLLAAGLIRCP